MLNKIINFSLQNRILILLVALFLTILGIYVTVKSEIDVFPDLNAPTVVIMTEAPGYAPEEIEKTVTFPIETVMNGATGVRRVRSSSNTGFSTVSVEFDWGTDIYQARQTVMEKLTTVSQQFPAGVEAPVLGPQTSILGEMLIVSLTADSTSLLDLRTIADRIREEVIQKCVAVGHTGAVIRFGISAPQLRKGAPVLDEQLGQNFQQIPPVRFTAAWHGAEQGGAVETEYAVQEIPQVVGTGPGKGILHINNLHLLSFDKDVSRVKVGVDQGFLRTHITVAQLIGLGQKLRVLQPRPQRHGLGERREGGTVEKDPLLHHPPHAAVGKALGQGAEGGTGQVEFRRVEGGGGHKFSAPAPKAGELFPLHQGLAAWPKIGHVFHNKDVVFLIQQIELRHILRYNGLAQAEGNGLQMVAGGRQQVLKPLCASNVLLALLDNNGGIAAAYPKNKIDQPGRVLFLLSNGMDLHRQALIKLGVLVFQVGQ